MFRVPTWLRQTGWPGRMISFSVFGLSAGVILTMIGGYRLIAAGLVAQRDAWIFLVQASGIYLAGGLAAGVLVAVLYPLGRWIVGAFVVGAAAAVPMYFMFGQLLATDESPRETAVASVLLAALVGGPVATAVWLEDRGRNLPAWVAMLRYPTWRTVRHAWMVAVICAAVAWYVGLRWSGQWPGVAAVFLFLGPAALATLVTIMATRQSNDSAT